MRETIERAEQLDENAKETNESSGEKSKRSIEVLDFVTARLLHGMLVEFFPEPTRLFKSFFVELRKLLSPHEPSIFPLYESMLLSQGGSPLKSQQILTSISNIDTKLAKVHRLATAINMYSTKGWDEAIVQLGGGIGQGEDEKKEQQPELTHKTQQSEESKLHDSSIKEGGQAKQQQDTDDGKKSQDGDARFNRRCQIAYTLMTYYWLAKCYEKKRWYSDSLKYCKMAIDYSGETLPTHFGDDSILHITNCIEDYKDELEAQIIKLHKIENKLNKMNAKQAKGIWKDQNKELRTDYEFLSDGESHIIIDRSELSSMYDLNRRHHQVKLEQKVKEGQKKKPAESKKDEGNFRKPLYSNKSAKPKVKEVLEVRRLEFSPDEFNENGIKKRAVLPDIRHQIFKMNEKIEKDINHKAKFENRSPN